MTGRYTEELRLIIEKPMTSGGRCEEMRFHNNRMIDSDNASATVFLHLTLNKERGKRNSGRERRRNKRKGRGMSVTDNCR